MELKEIIKKVNKATKSKPVKLPKAKKETKMSPNWSRIISLSAAGQYIQNQLNDELSKIKKHGKK